MAATVTPCSVLAYRPDGLHKLQRNPPPHRLSYNGNSRATCAQLRGVMAVECSSRREAIQLQAAALVALGTAAWTEGAKAASYAPPRGLWKGQQSPTPLLS